LVVNQEDFRVNIGKGNNLEAAIWLGYLRWWSMYCQLRAVSAPHMDSTDKSIIGDNG